jgi:hypothetical protein
MSFCKFLPLCCRRNLLTRRLRRQALNRPIKPAWDRCYDFKNIFSKILAKTLAFFVQNTASFSKNCFITLVLKKIAIFSAENWAKIAENCDHNIDPMNLKNKYVSICKYCQSYSVLLASRVQFPESEMISVTEVSVGTLGFFFIWQCDKKCFWKQPGVDVMITIFCEKIVNIMIKFLHNLALFWVKTPIFWRKYFLKSFTSVPKCPKYHPILGLGLFNLTW